MLNQPKVSKSPRSQKSIFGYSIDESPSSYTRSFLQCDVTKTPRRDIFATPPKHRLINSTPRYSLSEVATPPRSSRRDYGRSNYLKNCTGPLLASTRFNVNVSTYEDAKSPGLASRIVQYNEEAEREKGYKRPPTHQAKYGSPGLFPVVHLFKKDLPRLEQKPRSNSLHFPTPEHIRHQSPEYNRKLMEGIIRPSSASMGSPSFVQPNGKSSPSTRSVLDALKEISRKRIHAHEELDLSIDSAKRGRTNQINGDSNKRYRDGSPSQDDCTKPLNKKLCVYDEYAASCSSMDFSFTKTETSKSKKISVDTSTSTEIVSEEKGNKFINAETQTTLVDDEKDKTDKAQKNNIPVLTLADRLRKEEPVKLYEDDPIGRIRKHRLSAASDSANETKEHSNIPTLDTVLKEPIPIQPEKPLVSILTNNKSLRKSDKHVHFSIPESTTQVLPNSGSSLNTEASAIKSRSTIINTNLETPAPPSSPVNIQPTSSDAPVTTSQVTFSTSSSAPLLPPKVPATDTNTSVPKINFDFTKTLQPIVPTNNQFNIPVVPQTLSTTGSPKTGGFKFDLNKPSASVASLPATSSLTPATVGTSVTSTSVNTSKPTENNIATTNATFTFGNLTSKQDATSALQFGNVPASTTAVNSSSLLFPPNTSIGFGNSPNISTGMNFGTSTTTTSFSSPITSASASPFTFGQNKTDAGVKLNFGASQTSTSVAGTGVTNTAANSISTATTVPSTFNVTTATVPSFGNNKPVFSFGANTEQTSSAPTFKFGATTSSVTTSNPTFGSTSTTSSFGTALTSSSFVATTIATSTPTFGSTSSTNAFGNGLNSTGFGNTAVTNAFGPSNNNTSFALPTTSTVGFVTPVSSSSVGFGGATTANPNLGNQNTTTNSNFTANKAPLFGGNQSTPFGTAAPTTSSSSGFGVTVSTTPFGTNTPGFGSTTTHTPFGITTNVASFNPTVTTTTAFGDKSNLPSFGSAGGFSTQTGNIFVSSAAQSTGFGTQSSAPIFGKATSSPFGNTAVNTSTPTFGSNPTPTFTFAAKTTTSSAFPGNSSFGASAVTNGGFANSATPSFGNSNNNNNTFGANTFGSGNQPGFAAASTTQNNAFGVSNPPSFGTASSNFGANKSIFGNSAAPAFETPSTTLAFGTGTVTPAFGSTAPNSGFGSTNNPPSFGTTTPGAAFVKPQAAPATFGSSNTFGATNTGFNVAPPATQANVFSFGAGNATAAKPTGFSFGTAGSADPPKPTFNFTGGTTNPPAFGSNSSTTFSNTTTPNFGAPQFGAATSAAPVFNIGAAPPTSNRARTHLKAKRRT